MYRLERCAICALSEQFDYLDATTPQNAPSHRRTRVMNCSILICSKVFFVHRQTFHSPPKVHKCAKLCASGRAWIEPACHQARTCDQEIVFRTDQQNKKMMVAFAQIRFDWCHPQGGTNKSFGYISREGCIHAGRFILLMSMSVNMSARALSIRSGEHLSACVRARCILGCACDDPMRAPSK